MLFEPNRSAGLRRLSRFLPSAGHVYANNRNYDDGPAADAERDGVRANVSGLSPWLHAGLISETEVVAAVLDRHGAKAADKFIAEVFWRIYFKGYLEQRPSVWTAYLTGRDAALSAMEANAGLQKAYTGAVSGCTGIEAFDHWARELTETGYLHNHARMWFASIWIFTLKLDWHLGADFFLRHLVDGDAASNTLSWRWIAGLHTKGKTYLARPDNIARYTANQPGGALGAEGLADEAIPLTEEAEHGRQTLDLPAAPVEDGLREPYALILHDEGASHEPLALKHPPALVIGAARPAARSSLGIGDAADTFAHGAVAGGTAAAAEAFECQSVQWEEGARLSDILGKAGIRDVALPYLPQGWTRDALMPEIDQLKDQGSVTALLSDAERATWPLAKAGFFGVKKKIETVLNEIGLSAG